MNSNPQEHPVLFPSAATASAPFYYHSGQVPITNFPTPPGYPQMQNVPTNSQFYNGPVDTHGYMLGSQSPSPLMMPLVPSLFYMQHPSLGSASFMHPQFYPMASQGGGPGSAMYSYIHPPSNSGVSGMSRPQLSYSQESTNSSVRPLSTSTPLPTEFPTVCGTSQLPNIAHLKIAHLKYHATMDHDDVLANVSRITISSDGGENTLHEKDISDTAISAKSQQSTGRQPFVPFNYKTRLCSSYADNKPCEMAQRCRFAHGMEELRQVDTPVRPPNMRYKTRLCKNYTIVNDEQQPYCPYGLRCEFIHPTDKEFSLLPKEMRSLVPRAVLLATNPADITPDDVYRRGPSSATGSVVEVGTCRMSNRHRNIAGSLMCLASSGSSHASESCSYESGNSQTYSKPRFKHNSGVQGKFSGRRSFSTQNINRWRSTDKMVEK